METRTRAKTRHTKVETEPRPRHVKPCPETVTRQDTCLETPSLLYRAKCFIIIGIYSRPCAAIKMQILPIS